MCASFSSASHGHIPSSLGEKNFAALPWTPRRTRPRFETIPKRPQRRVNRAYILAPPITHTWQVTLHFMSSNGVVEHAPTYNMCLKVSSNDACRRARTRRRGWELRLRRAHLLLAALFGGRSCRKECCVSRTSAMAVHPPTEARGSDRANLRCCCSDSPTSTPNVEGDFGFTPTTFLRKLKDVAAVTRADQQGSEECPGKRYFGKVQSTSACRK